MPGWNFTPAPTNDPKPDQSGVVRYAIRIKGHLDPSWSDWFDGMTVSNEGVDTVLSGMVLDQAALHGLLARVRDLNLTLISLNRIE